jgi:hypothetical protein
LKDRVISHIDSFACEFHDESSGKCFGIAGGMDRKYDDYSELFIVRNGSAEAGKINYGM